jgi:hypothetical protein
MNKWVRFLCISDMNHCDSGPGAWMLGQGGNAAASRVSFERQRKVFKAVVNWTGSNKT